MSLRKGIVIETGSWGREYPYQIHPELYADPFDFYKRRVMSWSREHKVEHFLWHRAYGEPTPGDPGQDFDSINYHLSGEGNRQFALNMSNILRDLSDKSNLTIYTGAIWQTRMRNLLRDGDVSEWLRRIVLQFQMFPNASFALDGSADTTKINEAETMLVLLLSSLMPDRFLVEALPKPGSSLEGKRAIVWENVWAWQKKHAGSAREITRVLSMHARNVNPIDFAKDCAKKGHHWFVEPTMLSVWGVTFEEMVEAG